MDTNTPLTQFEAGRVKNEMELKHDKKIKYRELYGYSPDIIAARFGFRPREIAEMAGRGRSEPKERNGVRS